LVNYKLSLICSREELLETQKAALVAIEMRMQSDRKAKMMKISLVTKNVYAKIFYKLKEVFIKILKKIGILNKEPYFYNHTNFSYNELRKKSELSFVDIEISNILENVIEFHKK